MRMLEVFVLKFKTIADIQLPVLLQKWYIFFNKLAYNICYTVNGSVSYICSIMVQLENDVSLNIIETMERELNKHKSNVCKLFLGILTLCAMLYMNIINVDI